MPGPHAEVYETTTLAIVIFTTVVCGGLTEPMLSRMDMKRQAGADDDDDDDDGRQAALLPEEVERSLFDSTSTMHSYELMASASGSMAPPGGTRRRATNKAHRMWRKIDTLYMKPLFGGRDDSAVADDPRHPSTAHQGPSGGVPQAGLSVVVEGAPRSASGDLPKTIPEEA